MIRAILTTSGLGLLSSFIILVFTWGCSELSADGTVWSAMFGAVALCILVCCTRFIEVSPNTKKLCQFWLLGVAMMPFVISVLALYNVQSKHQAAVKEEAEHAAKVRADEQENDKILDEALKRPLH